MRKKKDLPLTILKALEPFVKLQGHKFKIVDPKDNYLKVVDKDPDSDFHFTIENYRRTDQHTFQFLMKRKPRDHNVHTEFQSWIEVSGLNGQFDFWIKLLEEYETINSFFDDPILKSYKEEFYAEFELVDNDADINPFTIKQILLLDNYLESVEARLNDFATEQNKNDIQDIKEEIGRLRENLTNKSKRWVVENLSKVWAKIAKQGTKYINEFLSESKKEIVKQGVKGIINFVKEHGHDLLN